MTGIALGRWKLRPERRDLWFPITSPGWLKWQSVSPTEIQIWPTSASFGLAN
jgi:hypothetical protein